MHIGILADDLTGAMDAGMQALRFGLLTAVTTGALQTPQADVIVYDTESRNAPDAPARVQAAAQAFARAKIPLAYKKIDSTLRGPVGAELEALFEGGFCRRALIAPALPALGRTTRGGVHYVNGAALSQTELAHDPFAPVTDSSVCALIARGCPRKGAVLPLETVRAGLDAIRAALMAHDAAGAAYVVADAETNEDLRLLALAAPQDTLLCGSAGLFAYLPDRLGLSGSAAPVPPGAQEKPTLVLSGSPAAISKAQLDALDAHTLDAFAPQERWQQALDGAVRPDPAPSGRVCIRLNADAGAQPAQGFEEKAALAARRAALLLQRGWDTAVDLAGDSKEAIAARYRDDPDALDGAKGRVALLAGQIARLCAGHFGALVIFGGDTALFVCAALGAQGIALCGQAEPLIPIGRLSGGALDGAPIVTKAGGFGRRDSLRRLLRRWDPAAAR